MLPFSLEGTAKFQGNLDLAYPKGELSPSPKPDGGSVAQSCPTLCNPMDCSPTRLLYPWNFLGKNTGVSCHFLLQGLFLTQGLNLCVLCFLHRQADSLPLHYVGYSATNKHSPLNIVTLYAEDSPQTGTEDPGNLPEK